MTTQVEGKKVDYLIDPREKDVRLNNKHIFPTERSTGKWHVWHLKIMS